MLVKKNFSERWKLTLPFMHTNTLTGLLNENKLHDLTIKKGSGIKE